MKKILIICVIFFATIVGLIVLGTYKKEPTIEISNPDQIFKPLEESGLIGDKIIGDPEKAKIVVYEYADFGCPHCAEWNRTIGDLMGQYDGKIALVFRYYNLRSFNNSYASARAATAAQMQGYFKEYKDLLFSNQSEWIYADAKDAENIFIDYFKISSDGSGNVEKFIKDMQSQEVEKRLKFEQRIGKATHLKGTPYFRINGEAIDLEKLSDKIKDLLND